MDWPCIKPNPKSTWMLFLRGSVLYVQDLHCRAHKGFEAGQLSKSELALTVDGQKKLFPKGIEECGADALRFTLCSVNVKSTCKC